MIFSSGIRNVLLESEENQCPDCKEKDTSPETLIPNRFLRNAVNNFRNKTGYKGGGQRVKRNEVERPKSPAIGMNPDNSSKLKGSCFLFVSFLMFKPGQYRISEMMYWEITGMLKLIHHFTHKIRLFFTLLCKSYATHRTLMCTTGKVLPGMSQCG